MRCETSFFSLTLYKKLLTRYWPMWAVWLIGWLGAVPVTLLNNATWPDYCSRMAANLASYPAASSILMAIMAIITAVGVYFYLFKGKAMNLMGALPLRREGLFASACAAGFTILLAPLVVVVLVTLPVEAALGCLNVPALLQLLGGCCLTAFFWFSFATLCCVISGSCVASAAFYAIFNGVVLIMSSLVEALLDLFFYGYAGLPYAVEDAVQWCTPLVNLFRTGTDWWERAWIYAGVGFLMLLAALGLHHIRKAERAGDLVSFTALRYAFKVCVILCGGLSLGMVFLFLFFGSFGSETIGLPLTLCCCAAAVVSAFVAEMLLKKTFRVWKSWRWAVVSAAAFALLLAVPQYDLIGFENRVPDPSRVISATASFRGDLADDLARNGLLYDGEDAVAALERLHTFVLETRKRTLSGGEVGYCDLDLNYNIKGGLNVHRKYTLYLDQSQLGSQLNSLLTDAMLAGRANFEPPTLTPSEASITWDNGERGASVQVSATEARQLLEAAMEDMDAGRYGPDDSSHATTVYVYFQWGDGWNGWTSRTFYCTSNTTSINAAISRLYPTPPYSDLEGWAEDAEVTDWEYAEP